MNFEAALYRAAFFAPNFINDRSMLDVWQVTKLLCWRACDTVFLAGEERTYWRELETHLAKTSLPGILVAG